MKTGLVLSGGGSRAIAQLGVIKALEELGAKPDIISGASAGAIVGAFYAAGFSVDEMLDIVLTKRIFHFPGFSWHTDGLLKTRAITNTCRLYLGRITFKKLKLPFYVAATNLLAAKTEYFQSGDVATVITASSAVPGIFEPVKYKGSFYADAGILNNFPTEPLLGKCDVIIGVHVNPLNRVTGEMSVPVILDRVIHMAIYNEAASKAGHCNVFIEPPHLRNYGLFEFAKAQEIFDIGYRYTMSVRKEIQSLGRRK